MPTTIKSTTIDEIYQVLLNQKGTYQPHCISRALQLLDPATIQKFSPTNGKTNICKFAVGDHTAAIDLATYKPLKSVAQLFGKVNPIKFKDSQDILRAFVGTSATTTPIDSTKLKSLGQTDEVAALENALNRLSKAFEVIQENPIEGFHKIQVKQPKECNGITDTIEIKNQQTTLKLQSVAQQLLGYHINNTIEISKFLKIIFNISQRPNGSWAVEGPKTEILFAGFPILDQLTEQARELLIDYYSGCETLYQKGVELWKDSSKASDENVREPPI